ncbi:uncharacterized protein LOC131685204 [Topomyia yanbarensis]|uniref:uncharacterized protein LOC131685204 n=1 Tax=Topomyia yanbarensis TaxID=2498891 RepID=UPI00273BBE65|nr:uncharacterized protein LOC131685204 [Topomyia yanbarensis]
MSHSAVEDGSDQEMSLPGQSDVRLQNGPMPSFNQSNEVAMLREENCRLLTTLIEYKKVLENTKLRYGTVKKDYYAAKKRLKRLSDKLQVVTGSSVPEGTGSESGESTPAQPVTGDDDVRKKWKEPNVKAAVKLKAAIGVHGYQSLIKDGELQLPSLRTISRYVDTLKKAGLRPNYDFNVRDSDTVGKLFVEEDDSGDVDHNRNQQDRQQLQQHQQQQQQQLMLQQQSREASDGEDAVNFTGTSDISFYPGKIEPVDADGDDDDRSERHHNGDIPNGDIQQTAMVQIHHPHHHHQQQQQQQHHQTLTSGHIEFLKSMTGFRKKWTPFELRTCMDIRRIIGSKEYDSLRKKDGMPLPSAKTLRKYKHAVHLEGVDGVDVMGRKRTHREMMDGVVTGVNGVPMNGVGPYGNDFEDMMNADDPDGFFDINGLTEEQIDFLQSLSTNTKGFSDFELQKTLELKNELGGKNYEILRKQECLHIPTLVVLKRYEQENGLEDLSAMVVAEDLDDEDDQEAEQEPEIDAETEYDNGQRLADSYTVEMNGIGEDSHMGIFEHHSIFDKDDSPSFDMSKLTQQHIEFLSTLPENPKRWTTQMINSALDIKNVIGTRDYEQLRRQGIPLPAARTLRRHKDVKSRVVEGEVAC